jgi:ATPase subunit of ABC transporter with duplicated ATPase domains
MVELDRRTARATHYGGGWEAYVRERDAAGDRARADHEHARKHQEQLIAAERETRRRAAARLNRARARVHDNDKNSREWVTMRAEEMTTRARKMGGRGRRIEVPDAPWQPPALRLHLTAAQRRGRWVVSLDGVVVRRRDWSLAPLEFAIAHGERVLVSGPNGSGKSTLLSAPAGHLRLTEGRRRTAPGAVVVKLGQAREALTGDRTLVHQVRELTGLDEPSARTALASFGLGARSHGNAS